MSFPINSKVVCVDDSPGRITGQKLLKKGSVYSITKSWHAVIDKEVLCSVAGIELGLNDLGLPIGFSTSRFRLVSEVQLILKALRKSVKTIQTWKQSGKITPEVQSGHPAYDLDSVKGQLAKHAKSKARARKANRSTALPPGMVSTIPAS